MAETNSRTTKSSAARAKPARAAGSSVKRSASVSSSVGNKASKREIAAAKLQSKTERDDQKRNEQRIYNIVDILTKQNPDYRHKRRIWFGVLCVGLVMTIATLIFGQVSAAAPAESKELYGTLTGATLIGAYIFVIAAFIYDVVKVRPIRKEADQRARSMSEKKREELIVNYDTAEAERRRAKRAAKEAAKK